MNTYNPILYVDDMAASAGFYRKLLGRDPVESSPNFTLFALDGGILLGLWARHDVSPKPAAGSTGFELFWPMSARAAVDAAHTQLLGYGCTVVQAPVDLEFGYSFVALDPDHNRLRICHLKQG